MLPTKVRGTAPPQSKLGGASAPLLPRLFPLPRLRKTGLTLFCHDRADLWRSAAYSVVVYGLAARPLYDRTVLRAS